jgi:hypothetical protein
MPALGPEKLASSRAIWRNCYNTGELLARLRLFRSSTVAALRANPCNTRYLTASAATFLLNTRTFLPYSMKITRIASSSSVVTARPT